MTGAPVGRRPATHSFKPGGSPIGPTSGAPHAHAPATTLRPTDHPR